MSIYKSYLDAAIASCGKDRISYEDVAWVSVPAKDFDELFAKDSYYDKWFAAVMVDKSTTGLVHFRRCPYESISKPGVVWAITGRTLEFLSHDKKKRSNL